MVMGGVGTPDLVGGWNSGLVEWVGTPELVGEWTSGLVEWGR